MTTEAPDSAGLNSKSLLAAAEAEFENLKTSPPAELLGKLEQALESGQDPAEAAVSLGRYVVANLPVLAQVWAGRPPVESADSVREVTLRSSGRRQSESLPHRFDRTVGVIAALAAWGDIEAFNTNAAGHFAVHAARPMASEKVGFIREATLLAASAPVAFPPYASPTFIDLGHRL